MMGQRLGAVKPPAHRQRARGGLDGRSIASVLIGLFDHDGQEDVEIADGIRAKNSTFHLDLRKVGGRRRCGAKGSSTM